MTETTIPVTNDAWRVCNLVVFVMAVLKISNPAQHDADYQALLRWLRLPGTTNVVLEVARAVLDADDGWIVDDAVLTAGPIVKGEQIVCD